MTNLIEIIQYATKAPSGHNTQPWKFKLTDNEITIFPDYTRALHEVDNNDHELFISLGCALENMLIAANHFGYTADIHFDLENSHKEKITVKLIENPAPQCEVLFDEIDKRQTNRHLYLNKDILTEDLLALSQFPIYGGVKVHIITPKDFAPLIEIVKEATIIQYKQKNFLQELVDWLRFNTKEAEEHRDGLFMPLLGLPRLPRWLGAFVIKKLLNPKQLADKFAKTLTASSVAVLFTAANNDKRHWIEIGRTFQRLALIATAKGISHSHMNMPCEILSTREKICQQYNLGGAHPLLLIRLGYAERPAGRALRRDLEEVLVS